MRAAGTPSRGQATRLRRPIRRRWYAHLVRSGFGAVLYDRIQKLSSLPAICGQPDSHADQSRLRTAVLNRPQTSTGAFRRSHSLLRHFFEYWAARDEMARLCMPSNRSTRRSRFFPFIYSRDDLHRFLYSARLSRTPNDKTHYSTMRAAFLTLYATGATAGDEDVDWQNGFIRFSGSRVKVRALCPNGKRSRPGGAAICDVAETRRN